MKKVFTEDFYLGVDIGTDSVGWAVTNSNYELMKFNGKTMWGVRLFDEAQPAEERRTFRTSRRRIQRRNDRIKLLQEIFAIEIGKIDNSFFQRLNDSRLLPEDKNSKQIYSIFNEKDYTDIEYYKEYPTIYHLRKDLILNQNKHDVRLVYLAIHNIMKYRGHFLFDGNLESATDFKQVFAKFVGVMKDELEIEFDFSKENVEEIEVLLKNRKINNSSKKTKMRELLGVESDNKQKMAVVALISGLAGDLAQIFPDSESVKELEKSSVKFSESSYDDKRLEFESSIPEECSTIDVIKSLYDWSILAEILAGGESEDGEGKAYISVAKVKQYEKHSEDLKLLKSVVKKYIPQEFRSVFSSQEEQHNYANYIGHTKRNGKKYSVKKCTRDDFYKFLNNKIKTIKEIDDEKIEYIKEGIEEGSFLKLQVNKDNGVIPYQVHKAELIKILDHAQGYLPFLHQCDAEGISNRKKIEMIFEFRVPYYVGPLNTYHKGTGGNSWMIRKEEGAIRPWNFKQKVDEDASAIEFISRMTNKCTYLLGEDVLPRNSLIYSEYSVLNELNNLQIKGEKASNALKKKIYDDLFKNKSKVTGKVLLEYLKSEGYEVVQEDLSGFDKDFKSALTAYLDFKKKVFKDAPEQMELYNTKIMVEDIIKWICIYGDDKKMLKRVIENNYPTGLTEEQLKATCSLKYTGWGRFSRKLLENVYGTEDEAGTGEAFSIIEAMRETTNNFMQLLSNKFTFKKAIDETNAERENKITKITYENITDDLYVSPAIKRAIWQVVTITEEIRKIMGKQPKKIFVEMARGDKDALKGDAGRKQSRKNNLIGLYENIKDEAHDWKTELEKTEDSRFNSRQLYLYYTQKGRCMYSGDRIELSELANTNMYDRDHIYPQSKTKDDSLNNLVLVKKGLNSDKGDRIVSTDIQKKMILFWKELLRQKLISEEKYKRLTRTTPLTEDELAGFINRQLVETRQSSKAVAELFKKLYTDAEVVYVKSELVSSFRHENEFVKARSINDYHHAKDAYLNIVVGNVYNEKFTANPARWLKENRDTQYSLNQVFNHDVEKKGKIVWQKGNQGTIATVKRIMAKNNILYTRHATVNKGGLFNQQPIGKDKNSTIPLKQGMDPSKYGGYSGVTPAYFALVESDDKKGKKLTIEAVPLYLVGGFEKEPAKFIEYCEQKYELINPVVKISKIKKNTLLVVNGFPMHLRGIGGKNLILQGAVQLCLDDTFYKNYKNIEKYIDKNTSRADKRQNLAIREKYDGISKEENLNLYDELLKKHKDTIYSKRPANQTITLLNGREIFIALTVEEQCIVLGEIISLFICRPVTANLTLIKGSAYSGSVSLKQNLMLRDSVILKNQSSTGLFEQSIDLLKL
jgi:CRISPR-associated protein Cas9/Csn1, subtype II/NMEMI